MMEFSQKNEKPRDCRHGARLHLERQLTKAPAFTKDNSHNIAYRQGFCADCYYFRTVQLERRQRTFCSFTGEKIGLYSTGCGFYAEVSAYD